MHESRGDGGVAVAAALLIGFILLAGAAAAWMWQREQRALAESRMARAMAEEARARALAEQQRLQALQPAGNFDGNADDFESIEVAVLRVLDIQQQAWNAGDIDQFMQHYWKSENLTFSSSGKLTRGWQAILENYKQRYPTREAMGQVSFRNLDVTPLGPNAAMVIGEWQLTRESDNLGGKFTLVFRQIEGNWLIIHDHTSRAE